MRRSAFSAFFLLALFSANLAQGEFYRWVDRDGKEFFTNDREKVPSEYRGSASAVSPDENRVSVGTVTVPKGSPSKRALEHKDKYGRGELYWRKRAAKLRKELSALQSKYDQFLKREEESSRKTSSSRGSTGKKSNAGQLKKKEKMEQDLARKKNELEVKLPDEARKADAYPGWLRE
jgi:hypothetical protein